MPSSRSGALRWKKLSAWLCTSCPQFIMRRNCSARAGIRHAQDGVAGFGRSQQVAYRADAANAGCDAWHFPEAATNTEFLETTEFGDMEAGVFDFVGVVEMNGDFGVSLDASDWIYRNCS